MAALTPRQLAAVLIELTAEKTKAEADKAVTAFVTYLAEEGLLVKWREIERELHTEWKKKFGASQVTVVSAHALTKEARKALEDVAPGADIVERTDPRLMAGAVVRIDDRRIDGSLAGRIARLQKELQTTV